MIFSYIFNQQSASLAFDVLSGHLAHLLVTQQLVVILLISYFEHRNLRSL